MALPDRRDVVEPVIARALQLNDSLIEARRRRVEVQASLATVDAAMASGGDLRQHVGLVQEAVGEQVLLAAWDSGPATWRFSPSSRRSCWIWSPNSPASRRTTARRTRRWLRSVSRSTRQSEHHLASYYTTAAGTRPDLLPAEELGPLLLKSMLEQGAGSKSSERERQMAASFETARADAIRQSGAFVSVGDAPARGRTPRGSTRLDVFEKIEPGRHTAGASADPRVTIVQEPLPSDRARVAASCGSCWRSRCSSGLGPADSRIVWLQDLLDDRFGSPDEMAMQLGVQVLALVRQLSANAVRQRL